MSKLFLKVKFRKKSGKWLNIPWSFLKPLNEAINFFERSLCICLQSRWWHCDINISHSMTKPTKRPVRRVKTQINLGICPVWSESSLSAWRSFESLATHFVGFVMLRLSLLLCKSINLRELILSFFSLLWGVPGWEGGRDRCVHNNRLCWFQFAVWNMQNEEILGSILVLCHIYPERLKKSLWIPVFKS